METKVIVELVLVGIASLIVLLAPLLHRHPKFQLNLQYIAVAVIISAGNKLTSSYFEIQWWIGMIAPIVYVSILYFISKRLVPFLRHLYLRCL